MRHRRWNKLGATLFVVAMVAALLLVVNPELRALLLLADSLGLEMLTLLLLMQLKTLRYALFPAAAGAIGSLCTFVFCIGSRAMRTYPKALFWWPFDKLVCPALVFVIYGMRCRVPNDHPT